MRIFFDELVDGEELELTDDVHHHLKNVLRASAGKKLDILTKSELLSAEVVDVQKRSTLLRINGRRPLQLPNYNITVYQSLMKRDYMDTVVEKYAELGVASLVPVISQRSLPDLKDTAMKRFNEIAKFASLQSEQDQLMTVSEALTLPNIPFDKDANNILFYERSQNRGMPNISKNKVNIVVGPEGGFSDDEVTILTQKGYTLSTPLSSILKAETAAVVFAGVVRISLEQLCK